MKDYRSFDKTLSIISIVVVIIIVFVFALTISNMHLAKTTYSSDSCPTRDECVAVAEDNIQYYPYGYTCNADSNGCFKIHKNGKPSNPADQYTYKIVFYNWKGTQALGSCKAWANGKVDTNTCQGNICCGSWSTSPNQSSGGYSTQAIYGQSWTSNRNFYCVSETSEGCYGNGYVDDEPSTEAPKPSTEEPKPSTEVPKPSTEAPKPSTEAPKPSTEAPKPSTEAPKPSTEAPKDKCYSCKLGEGNEYEYATSPEEAANKTGGTSCVEVSNTNCDNKPKSCYACDTKDGKQYLNTTSKENAEKAIAGATNCTIVKNSYCEIVPNNPKTGLTGIVIAWMVGLSAIVYSLWYFKKSSSIN